MKVESFRPRAGSPEAKKLKVKNCGVIFSAIFLLFTIYCSLFTDTVTASDKWQGVDESVVEKVAKEHGREAKEPLINTDQGDLLLFVFLIAGAVGGFAAGYYWKELIVKGQQHDSSEKQKIDR